MSSTHDNRRPQSPAPATGQPGIAHGPGGRTYRLALTPYHPVPYQVPFYRALHAHPRVTETVLFLDTLGLEEAYHDEFRAKIQWDVPLLDGYDHRFLSNWSRWPHRALIGRVNPGLINEIGSGRYDAVLITGYTVLSSYVALLAAKVSGTKVIMRAEANLHNPGRSLARWLKERLLPMVLRACDAVMYSSEANLQYFRHFGVPEERLFPLLSSVDNDYFKRARQGAATEARALRTRLGIHDDHVVVIFTGRFTDRKRPLDLLEAYSQLGARRDKAWLVYVGDGPLRPEMERRVSEAGLRHVIFTGFKNTFELSPYLAMADVFVLPSEYDPTPKAVNEAMLFGLPVLVSSGTGLADDLIRSDVNGFVFPVGDTVALADQLSRLIDDPALRTRLGRAGEEEVDRRSPEANAEGVVEALDYCYGEHHDFAGP